jgi:hypothetical protein
MTGWYSSTVSLGTAEDRGTEIYYSVLLLSGHVDKFGQTADARYDRYLESPQAMAGVSAGWQPRNEFEDRCRVDCSLLMPLRRE